MSIDRRNIKVRLAIDEEGPRVAELVESSGFVYSDWPVDWSDIAPHWIVADHLGEILGCIQVCYGRPVGRLELMSVDDSVQHPTRALVIKRMLDAGCSVLREYGCQAASGVVPFKMKSYKRFLKRRGAWNQGSGNLMMFRLR